MGRPVELLKMEEPVPNSDAETYKKFKESLDKSRILYEEVEEYKNYQCALLYNGTMGGQQDCTLLYTSSIDGKVYTSNLKYSSVYFKAPAIYLSLKPVYAMVERRIDSIDVLVGVVKHNGLLVLEPEYLKLSELHRRFIMGGKELNDGKKKYDIVDYAGNKILELAGDVWEYHMSDDFSEAAEVVILINNDFDGKLHTVYVVTESGKIYQSISLPTYRFGVRYEDYGVDIIEYKDDKRLKRKSISSAKELIRNAKLIYPTE